MDPLTALLAFATELVKLIEKAIDGQPPEVKAELWRLHIDDIKAWRAFWQGLIPKG